MDDCAERMLAAYLLAFDPDEDPDPNDPDNTEPTVDDEIDEGGGEWGILIY